ncbi:class I SAM-dependent methyltransferase [Thiobacillus sp.]|uniref:class I SAM-dependent methyltransferase n=1 Tax=Thiobacillus sp. TaxID=924 RepID=UPI0017D3DFFE|nr:class I SAM-dependent methyltransferase [Thiobacillus sp.]MBC2732266.1 class I SAM-dependent methyltransferase [Thiobacillus sp.]MBC2741004.1 class I SAM-dependent methyltransferase [Thiobacillus sp.]MBC2760052.1 class I SAM-dependent methyltransferase [Thiobacillus sp.]
MATELLREVAEYYSAKLGEYGVSPRGVDWNSEESQQLRFAQLSKIIQLEQGFSINDLGCGYGALFDYLSDHWRGFTYTGCDVSADMVWAAKERLGAKLNARFYVGSESPEVADYGVASGIFNVRLGRSDSEWHEYLVATLDVLDRTSRSGFAFNCLTSWSDADRMQDYLYYADPAALFDLCKRRYSRHVALLHDYGLYEFTMLVRKNP